MAIRFCLSRCSGFSLISRPIPFIVAYALSFLFNMFWLIFDSYYYWKFDTNLNQNSLKILEKFVGKAFLN